MSDSTLPAKSFVEPSLVTGLLAVLVGITKTKVEGANFIKHTLLSERYSGAALDKVEQLRSTATNYLSLIALTLVASSVLYLIRSRERRVFPAVSLALSLLCLALTLFATE